MEINLLEEREDDYQAFCVIFTPKEIAKLDPLRLRTMERIIKDVIEVGMGVLEE